MREKELTEEQEKVEQEFTEQVKAFKEIAAPLLIDLNRRVRELEALSEKMGVPFDFDDQTYVPLSMREQFPGLERYDYRGLSQTSYYSIYDDGGWANSSHVC